MDMHVTTFVRIANHRRQRPQRFRFVCTSRAVARGRCCGTLTAKAGMNASRILVSSVALVPLASGCGDAVCYAQNDADSLPKAPCLQWTAETPSKPGAGNGAIVSNRETFADA